MIPVKIVTITIMLCGLLIATVPCRCFSEEPAPVLNVKKTPTEAPPAFLTDISKPLPATSVTPEKEESKKSWFRSLMEGMFIGAAQYNTDRQSDGRPKPQTTAQ